MPHQLPTKSKIFLNLLLFIFSYNVNAGVRSSGEVLSSDYITPLMYGAKGDGKHDDTDALCSDIERFMTAGLLWDCINLGSFDEMKRLIKKVGKNVTKDYIFLKLLYHYNNRVLSGSEQEQEYIKLFAGLEAKDKFIPFVEQKRIEQKTNVKLTLKYG